MWTTTQLHDIKALLIACIDDADREIIDDIRRNDGKHGGRDALLAQLDALETVRERLHVRYDRITSASYYNSAADAGAGTEA